MNTPNWNNLPEIVLVEIFKYLPDKDRSKASMVNEQWHRAFESPCLWRTRHFEMGGLRALKNGYKASKFSDNFGQYLKRLFISCSHPSYHTCRLFQKSIEDVFGKLKDHGTQLTEFELCRLELDRYWKYETPKEKLITIFSKFLRTQNSIICIDLSSAQCPAFGGIRVLDAISQQSGSAVQDMLIEDFFHPRLTIFSLKKYQKVLSRFTNLKYLALNYNCFSEETIETLSKSLPNKLEFINIKIMRHDPHFHRIAGYTWTMFKRACPKLKVAFWFESVGSYTEIAPILVKDAPVKDVHIWTGYDEDRDWRLCSTVKHIADAYINTLEYLSLELDNTQEVIDDEIIQLVKQCKKLTEINLHAMVSLQTVEQLCELQREEKINLSLMHLTCCGLSTSDWTQLVSLREKYKPMIEDRKLDFKFTTDLLIEPTV